MPIRKALEKLVVGNNIQHREKRRRAVIAAAVRVLLKRPNGYSDHYSDIKFLDGGGGGMVFRATDRRTGQQVATKFLIPNVDWDNTSVVSDFRKEYSILQKLQGEPHVVKLAEPNLITLRQGDGPWHLPATMPSSVSRTWLGINLQLYDGDLRRLVAEYGPSMQLLRAVLPQCLAGLQAIHRHGYVHHDVKPENMLYANGVVVISDLGLTMKRTKPVAADGATCQLIGTDYYMSWAEARHTADNGAGCDDPYADIESLANALYTMFVGKLPWDRRSLESSVRLREAMYAQAPSSLNSVRAVIMRLGYDARQRRVPAVKAAALSVAVKELKSITGDRSKPKPKPKTKSSIPAVKVKRKAAVGRKAVVKRKVVIKLPRCPAKYHRSKRTSKCERVRR